jgi:hypothetical protein
MEPARLDDGPIQANGAEQLQTRMVVGKVDEFGPLPGADHAAGESQKISPVDVTDCFRETRQPLVGGIPHALGTDNDRRWVESSDKVQGFVVPPVAVERHRRTEVHLPNFAWWGFGEESC